MGNLLRKDMLLLLNARKELVILLLMPVVLIAILGFALGGIVSGGGEPLNVVVALVNRDDERESLESLKKEVEDAGVSAEARTLITLAASEASPVRLLRQTLEHENMKSWLAVREMDEESAQEALEAGEVDAILVIPEHFTQQVLRHVFLKQGNGSALHLEHGEGTPLAGRVLEDTVETFLRTYHFQTALVRELGMDAGKVMEAVDTREFGQIETVSGNASLTSFQYYTLAMAVMFVLFTASFTANHALVEKQQHVFDRVVLAGVHPYRYLGGKMFSAAAAAFIQLFILFAVSALVFRSFAGADVRVWGGLILLSAALSLCVGALASMLTSIVHRLQDGQIVTFFTSSVVTLLALVGGSFVPVSSLPEWVAVFGNWTPNGAALTALMYHMQGFGVAMMAEPLLHLAILSALFLTAGILIFPGRRLS